MEKLKEEKVSESDTIQIPADVLIDIFSRIPAKSIARLRCVSKLWRSIPVLPGFTELFLTKSLPRPRLLFAVVVNGDLLFFSSPQPQNPAYNSCLVATRYKCFPSHHPSVICPPLRGLVFHRGTAGKERVICNPATGESITLPEVKAKCISGENFFGYDPINKQFKVLCKILSRHGGGGANTHRVLTLETGKLIWRRTMECKPHSDRYGEICINGVLYYGAHIKGSCVIVCFDFCSEKFSFVKIHEEMSDGTLINYKGKLGVLLVKHGCEVVLWVLEEDSGKQIWSDKGISVGLSSYGEIGKDIHIVGMTEAGEIVFSPYSQSNPFYLFYFKLESNTFTKVNIHMQGFEEFKDPNISPHIFLDYAENMKRLQVCSEHGCFCKCAS
ncbi:unnamed protein product [Microthlaspi erraticum]|uniref:F-box domain-containing protein n=1 Tax=Microthlaspi erraticum TaxID=1685480 RepID=A0A6D2HZS1_9BRAS|nr:unnamed protein product [Microthlaspi erraticum]